MSFPPVAQKPQVQNVRSGAPKEGPLAVPVICDFSVNAGYTIDLTDLFNRGYISQLPCLFIDNSQNAASITVTVPDTGQNIVCPPNSQGNFWVFQGPNMRFTAQSSGTVKVQMEFLNFPIAPAVWSVNGEAALSGSGAMLVSDTILEGAVVGGIMQAAITGNLTYTNASGTITTGGTSQIALAANANIKALQIQNLSSGILMVNWGAAASATLGIALQAASAQPGVGGYYESAPGLASNQSINIWGATTGQPFTLKWA